MIDVYDEIGYIKNILELGLSPKWERDATLLVRYFKAEGYKKSKIKTILKTKCEDAATREDNPILYNHLISYKRLNSVIDNAWKQTAPLRAIHYVDISKEVLDWFLNLSKSYILVEDEAKKLKEMHSKIFFKGNTPLNWNRTKYLFTLYIWTKIQENYLERPTVHYLNQYTKRFKEDANLPTSFNMKGERNFLHDLGLIKVNNALGVEAIFIDKYDVFHIPITDQNRVRIYTGEPSDGDLYHCGYWLEKEKMGKFVCERCGKEFANYTLHPKGRPRKYCKECAEILRNHKVNNLGVVTRRCVDCGELYETSSKDTMSVRCPECQAVYKGEKSRLLMQELENSRKSYPSKAI